MRRRLLLAASASIPWLSACRTVRKPLPPPSSNYREPHRPQFHFTPAAGWMNDPSGLVFHNGLYHLFFQYHPAAKDWGPMHWGHATSRDLVHWEPQPIALEPEEKKYALSGSVVVDAANTAGFGAGALVALYTRHDAAAEQDGRRDYESQHLAYSRDGGHSWTPFDDGPVIANPGALKDFRDPKLFWHEPTRRWVAVLAAGDHAEFWGSPDLKRWTWLSDFGRRAGGHGGVWECPDFFALPVENGAAGEKRWVLLCSVGSGAPNGGSGTQYFVGDFDGEHFNLDPAFEPEVPFGRAVWLDQGRDHYAGATWSNAPDGQRILIAWMNNLDYAQQVPATSTWRGAMTLPVTLALRRQGWVWRLSTRPVAALESLRAQTANLPPMALRGAPFDLSQATGIDPRAMELELVIEPGSVGRCGVELSNAHGERYRIGYDATQQLYFSDRTQAGDNRFSRSFAVAVHTVSRPPSRGPVRLRLYFDASSAELFADDGLQMTEQYFPTEDFTTATLFGEGPGARLLSGRVHRLGRIWP